MYEGLVDKAFVLGIESCERHRSQIRALEDSASHQKPCGGMKQSIKAQRV